MSGVLKTKALTLKMRTAHMEVGFRIWGLGFREGLAVSGLEGLGFRDVGWGVGIQG